MNTPTRTRTHTHTHTRTQGQLPLGGEQEASGGQTASSPKRRPFLQTHQALRHSHCATGPGGVCVCVCVCVCSVCFSPLYVLVCPFTSVYIYKTIYIYKHV
jgi:hypothetical protein